MQKYEERFLKITLEKSKNLKIDKSDFFVSFLPNKQPLSNDSINIVYLDCVIYFERKNSYALVTKQENINKKFLLSDKLFRKPSKKSLTC